MEKHLSVVDLPIRKTVARTEHEAFRVDPDMKEELNALRKQGVAVSEWIYRLVARGIEELKRSGVKFK